MKKVLFVFTCFIFLFAGCSKKNIKQDKSQPEELEKPINEEGREDEVRTIIFFDNLEVNIDWTSGNTLNLDSDNPKEGVYSLKSEGNNDLRFSKKLITPFDAKVNEATGYLCLSLFVSDVSMFSGWGQIEISSGGKPDYYESAWGMNELNLKSGWNDLILKLSTSSKTFGEAGGNIDLSAINYIRIYQKSTSSIVFKIDNIRFTDFYDNGHVQNPKFHLYLLAGQSNMSGRGSIKDAYLGSLSSYADIENKRVKVLNADNEWITATHPVHYDYPDVGVGPGLDFALKMLENLDEDITIGLIPTAVGGSNIIQWQPGQVLFNRAVSKTIIASTDGVLQGVLFHQGEANVFDNTYVFWPDRVKALIAGFRTEFQKPELKFMIGELGYYRVEFSEINNLIPKITTSIPFTYKVSAEGLTHKGDNLHFSSASATELGIRYASTLLASFSGEAEKKLSKKAETN